MAAWEVEMRAAISRARREAEIGNDGMNDYLQSRIERMEKALEGFKAREAERRAAMRAAMKLEADLVETLSKSGRVSK